LAALGAVRARSRQAPGRGGVPSTPGARIHAVVLSEEPCGDAAVGDQCHAKATWAMRFGIHRHPEWYEGLTPQSPFRDFQAHLGDYAHCTRPCEASKSQLPSHSPTPRPTLFCFALIMPSGYEHDLVRSQLERGAGVFGCEEYAVYSNVSTTLSSANGRKIKTADIGGSLESRMIGGHAVNREIFVRVWHEVAADPRPYGRDWIVKADADAVFFPDRLRALLRKSWSPDGSSGDYKTFLKNCKYGMYGAVEVISHDALVTYENNSAWTCRSTAKGRGPMGEFHGICDDMPEDMYLERCLKMLGATEVDAFDLLLDTECHVQHWTSPFPCTSGQAAFHPFKKVDDWVACYEANQPR